jgi:glycosyltransferase involved in cell wall biosynthesis
MKVSIITVCLNSEKTIVNTLNSIITQNYKNIEHILVDGGSTDKTIRILRSYPLKNKKIIIKKNSNIYEAMNEGIKNSKGELIGILNSDDFYNNENTIKDIVNISKKSKAKIFLGDVVYFNNNSYRKITRHYSSNNFSKEQFKYGMMPPHPGSFIKKEVYDKYGLYNTDLQIASDFDIFSRFILKNNIPIKIINKIITRMKTGGISGKNIKAYFISTFEILKSLKINNINSNLFFTLLRLPKKLGQFFFFRINELNKNFNIKKHPFYEKTFKPNFTIIKNIQKLPFNQNFILSGMNLAFLGYFIKGNIKQHPNLLNWPDGLFSKIFELNIHKVPGRKILELLNFKNNNIKEVVVLGNLGLTQKKYIENLYKIKVINVELPYGNISFIKKNLKFKIKKNQICFITLPTPKQEELAYYLAKKNKFYKIICIGASINIASGVEKSVPKILSNVEFIWRLRYESIRRTRRLIETFIYFFYGRFLTSKIKNLNVEIIN